MAKQDTGGNAVGVGLGLAAATAVAAGGAYWLYGAKHSAKHRKIAKTWMLKARAEVMEGVEKLQEIDKDAYMQVVDTVMKRYGAASGATPAEMAHMMKDFKVAWSHMQKAHSGGKSKAKKTVKAVKKGVKKAAKKASKR